MEEVLNYDMRPPNVVIIEDEEQEAKVEDNVSPRARIWRENERKLALKLARSSLSGKEGLQFILLEIIKA